MYVYYFTKKNKASQNIGSFICNSYGRKHIFYLLLRKRKSPFSTFSRSMLIDHFDVQSLDVVVRCSVAWRCCSTFSRSTFSRSTFSCSTFSLSLFSHSTFSRSTFIRSTFSPSTFIRLTFGRSKFSCSKVNISTFGCLMFSGSTFSWWIKLLGSCKSMARLLLSCVIYGSFADQNIFFCCCTGYFTGFTYASKSVREDVNYNIPTLV